jgi:TonB family protein
VVVKKVQPEYPKEAREAHIQGQVVLRVTISREGEVNKVELVSGHPMLAAAAIDAVKQWKYQPFLVNGQPSERETEAVVDFGLQAGEGHPGTAAPDTPSAAATGVAGDIPGGIPPGQTSGVIGGIISSTPSTPRVATPQRVRISAGVSNGLVVKKVPPEYPDEARRGRIQGTVVMHAIIDKAGDIAKIELVSGHPTLAPAAIEAVKQWKYKPYLLNGNAVEVDTLIQVNFTLSGN